MIVWYAFGGQMLMHAMRQGPESYKCGDQQAGSVGTGWQDASSAADKCSSAVVTIVYICRLPTQIG